MVVMAIVVVTIVVMHIVVVIAVIFAVPMTFMDLPALLVVVVVRMGPVGTGIGRTLPDAGNPHIMAATLSPVAIDPGVAFSWRDGSDLITHWWRSGADINLNLAECRDC